MMKDTIIASIGKINAENGPRVADWRLIRTKSSRQEQYFVKARTEQARSVEETQYALTVYVDSSGAPAGSSEGSPTGEKVRGEATVTIQLSHKETEIEGKIRQAVFAASKSRNPWFDLPGPAEPKVVLPGSGFDKLDEQTLMKHVRNTLYGPEAEIAAAEGGAEGAVKDAAESRGGTPLPRINALELFVSREEKEFFNSKGLHTSTSRWKGYSEFVVEADSSKGAVELFDDIEFSDPDPERLSEATRSRLVQVRDRALATPMPALKDIPVILSGREAEEVFAWFFVNSSTAMIFTKASSFQVGTDIQKTEEDPIDLWAEPVIPGLPASSAFDADGFPLERTSVIEAGVLKTLVGSVRYADWLGVGRKGNFPLFSVSPGRLGIGEMRARPYLEPVMFSDFRLDEVTGDFGAEIRLAYYFDGKKRTPVTGGSISGSVAELRSTMRRSSELALASRSLCPKALLLQGVSITGISP
ncbi:MAG TPA: metallopeptidase TldD-related protein [Rectinemataceae bacterium]|nr:metallopeptidase TldD-related protein [Rectinemataceae bacterium]